MSATPEKVHSQRAHSPWGASSSHRWMACPASIKLSENAPPQKSSPYAAEGTCAHELAEVALVQDKPCSDFIGEAFEGWEVTEEMAEYVQIYVDYVNAASEGDNKDLIIEEKFHLDFIREGLFGSNDACVIEHFGTLEVIDLKYGKGKEVFAENNPQLKYYALGAAHGTDFEKVKLTIIQPRIQDPIKSVTISMDELEQFGEELGKAVDATLAEDAPLSAGEHCFFCPAKAICPEQRRAAQELAMVDFDNADVVTAESLPDPKGMDDRTLMNILDNADAVKKWLESVKSYAQHKAEKGGYVKGYKLVKGRANRKVQSETELHMAFGDEIYEKKLLGVGKLEKKFGKKEVADYLYKPEAALTLVHHTDKREEVEVASSIDIFNDTPINNDKGDNYDNFDF